MARRDSQDIKQVDEFSIFRQLHSGSIGDTYKVVDLNLEVVRLLKRIKPKKLHSGLALFEREPKILAHVQHENVVSLYTYRPDLHYFVLECIHGKTLAELIARKNTLPPRFVALYASEVCRGFSAIHRIGVVHLDIKPANLMLNFDGGVRIVDFGVAKSPIMTDNRIFGGTRSYMSPEQLAAWREGAPADNVGPTSDLFSLGVTMYEALCGQKPFDSDKRSRPAKRLEEIDPETPASLAEVIHKAIELDPADRYQSTMQMRLELNRLLGVRVANEATIREHQEAMAKYVLRRFQGDAVADVLDSATALYEQGKFGPARAMVRRASGYAPDHEDVRRWEEVIKGGPSATRPIKKEAAAAPAKAGRGKRRKERRKEKEKEKEKGSAPADAAPPKQRLPGIVRLAALLALASSVFGGAAALHFLVPPQQVTILVRGEGKNPIADAQVFFSGTPRCSTARNGKALYRPSWPGEYEVKAQLKGYATSRRHKIQVKRAWLGGQPHHLEFTVNPSEILGKDTEDAAEAEPPELDVVGPDTEILPREPPPYPVAVVVPEGEAEGTEAEGEAIKGDEPTGPKEESTPVGAEDTVSPDDSTGGLDTEGETQEPTQAETPGQDPQEGEKIAEKHEEEERNKAEELRKQAAEAERSRQEEERNAAQAKKQQAEQAQRGLSDTARTYAEQEIANAEAFLNEGNKALDSQEFSKAQEQFQLAVTAYGEAEAAGKKREEAERKKAEEKQKQAQAEREEQEREKAAREAQERAEAEREEQEREKAAGEAQERAEAERGALTDVAKTHGASKVEEGNARLANGEKAIETRDFAAAKAFFERAEKAFQAAKQIGEEIRKKIEKAKEAQRIAKRSRNEAVNVNAREHASGAFESGETALKTGDELLEQDKYEEACQQYETAKTRYAEAAQQAATVLAQKRSAEKARQDAQQAAFEPDATTPAPTLEYLERGRAALKDGEASMTQRQYAAAQRQFEKAVEEFEGARKEVEKVASAKETAEKAKAQAEQKKAEAEKTADIHRFAEESLKQADGFMQTGDEALDQAAYDQAQRHYANASQKYKEAISLVREKIGIERGIRLSLPEEDKEGNVLRMPIARQFQEATCVWTIRCFDERSNQWTGLASSELPGNESFYYTWDQPGRHQLELLIKDQDGKTYRPKPVETTIIAIKPMEMNAGVGEPLHVPPFPEGYRTYYWEVDGKRIPDARREFTVTFDEAGKYRVDLFARDLLSNAEAQIPTYRHEAYIVEVVAP